MDKTRVAPAKPHDEALFDAGAELIEAAEIIRSVSVAVHSGHPDADIALVGVARQVERLGARVLELRARS